MSPASSPHVLTVRPGVRDSFGHGLLPCIANPASRMTFSRSDRDEPALADWVVIEVTQRNLRTWLLKDALCQER